MGNEQRTRPRLLTPTDVMIYRTLGRTGLEVSVMGMGTGGHDPLGVKSGRAESEMLALLHRAFDLGIRLFDSSPGYGRGHSEQLLGRALASLTIEGSCAP